MITIATCNKDFINNLFGVVLFQFINFITEPTCLFISLPE